MVIEWLPLLNTAVLCVSLLYLSVRFRPFQKIATVDFYFCHTEVWICFWVRRLVSRSVTEESCKFNNYILKRLVLV